MLDQLRLVIKKIQVGRRAGHVKEDHVLHRRGKMRVPRGKGPKARVPTGDGLLGRQGGQRHRAEAHRAISHEVTAGQGEGVARGLLLGESIHHGLAIVSSRFRRTFPTTVQAASSASSTPAGALPA